MNIFSRYSAHLVAVSCILLSSSLLSAAEQERTQLSAPAPAPQIKKTKKPDSKGFRKGFLTRYVQDLCYKIERAQEYHIDATQTAENLTTANPQYQGFSADIQGKLRRFCVRNMASKVFSRHHPSLFLLFDGRYISEQDRLNGEHTKITKSPWKDYTMKQLIEEYYVVLNAQKEHNEHPFAAPLPPLTPQPMPANLVRQLF